MVQTAIIDIDLAGDCRDSLVPFCRATVLFVMRGADRNRRRNGGVGGRSARICRTIRCGGAHCPGGPRTAARPGCASTEPYRCPVISRTIVATLPTAVGVALNYSTTGSHIRGMAGMACDGQ